MKTYIESIFGPVQIVMLPDVEEEFGFLTGRMTEYTRDPETSYRCRKNSSEALIQALRGTEIN